MRFSVIIPCYNAASTIERAVRSVLGQTFTDFELLVIDDGSTDDTVERIRGLTVATPGAPARCGGPIRVLCQENRGAAAARNHGLREARGDNIAFLDADDFWEAEFLAEMDRALQSLPEAGAVCCNFYVLDSRGCHVARPVPPDGGEDAFLVPDYFVARASDQLVINTSGVVLRRATVEKAGLMREDLRRSQDTEYWARIAARGIEWAFHPRPLNWVDQTVAESLSRTRSGEWHARIPLPEEWSREIWPGLPAELVPSFTTLCLWRTRYLCAQFLEAGVGERARQAAREALPRAVGRPGQRLGLLLLAYLPPQLSWPLWRAFTATKKLGRRLARANLSLTKTRPPR